MKRIDAHCHYNGINEHLLALLGRLNLLTVNISVAMPGELWLRQNAFYLRQLQERPDHFAWITSFPVPEGDTSGYVDQCIAGLELDFEAGAIGCKIWKNIGMDLVDGAGRLYKCDDEIFQPIYEYLTAKKKPLLMHIGEPLACWLPLEENKPHCGYYKSEPQWHMYNFPEKPHHQMHIDARDQVLERNPELVVVGAHWGSLEYDTDEIGKRLDRYPNFYVDSSARLWDIALQETTKVKEFFEEYQDRLLWGTDAVAMTPDFNDFSAIAISDIDYAAALYQVEFAYYEGDHVDIWGNHYKGLALPQSILNKFYVQNALGVYGDLHDVYTSTSS
ncbi:MAG: amidohydrolase [Lentisphaeria bacterium]|nr:amidohydrolase [Lentisphaeria bacterium]